MLAQSQGNGNVTYEDSNCTDNELAKSLIAELLYRSNATQMNQDRKSYAPWFKNLILSLKERGFQYVDMAPLLNVDAETLRGFRKSKLIDLTRKPIDEASQAIMTAWNGASDHARQTLDHFWSHLGRYHQQLKISREEMRQTLINLGLKYPRGPKIKDEGATVKRPFTPHTLWEGDGKQMNIIINGEKFSYCWYAFCEQKTTLLVGATVGATESSDTFLSALRNGHEKAGFYAIGILIDNRLCDADLSAVRTFCQKHHIILVRTFPGNSKSNGNIENNFSVFERHVGDIHISGKNNGEIAQSIAQVVSEVFTQQRNHSPRRRLGYMSPEEAAKCTDRPEWMRSTVEVLARRLDRETISFEQKWQLIAAAREKFGALDQNSEDKLKKEVSKYLPQDLIGAQAAYLAQATKYPENTYRAEYFLAILRYKREQAAKLTYNEIYRAGLDCLTRLQFPMASSPELAPQIVSEFASLIQEPSPSHQLCKLDAIAWWLIGFAAQNSLPALWREVCQLMVVTNSVTLKQWARINEYIAERIGKMLYHERHLGIEFKTPDVENTLN